MPVVINLDGPLDLDALVHLLSRHEVVPLVVEELRGGQNREQDHADDDGPLRATLLRLGEQQHTLLLSGSRSMAEGLALLRTFRPELCVEESY